jgi:hypothetical protein
VSSAGERPTKRIAYDLKGGVTTTILNGPKRQAGEVRKKSAFQQAREEVRGRLEDIAGELEKVINSARDPHSAAHAELSVRAAWRIADGIARKAGALKEVRAGEPDASHPTRERAAKTDEEPRRDVIYDDGVAKAISHRWLWPVEQAWRRHILTAEECRAAKRFRDAFNDAQRMPSPTLYNDEPRGAPDPTNRNGLTPANAFRQSKALALAGGEAGFIWRRIEAEFRAVAWGLILEEPFPGKDLPPSVVAFGRDTAHTETDRDARWFAYGELKLTCVRLATIYRQFDLQRGVSDEIKADAEREAS